MPTQYPRGETPTKQLPLFDLSIASMRSNSSKSDGRMGREIDVSFTPLLNAAAIILASAGFPCNNYTKFSIIYNTSVIER